MALSPQVIHLIRLQVIDQIGDLFTVGEIAIMEEETCIGIVGIFVDMVDAIRIKGARATDQAVNFIPFGQQ
jgi:hypothetical protein